MLREGYLYIDIHFQVLIVEINNYMNFQLLNNFTTFIVLNKFGQNLNPKCSQKC